MEACACAEDWHAVCEHGLRDLAWRQSQFSSENNSSSFSLQRQMGICGPNDMYLRFITLAHQLFCLTEIINWLNYHHISKE